MIRNLLVMLIISHFALHGCSKNSDDVIMTVRGPVPAHQIGWALVHEHLLVDFIGADSTGYSRWNRDSVINRVIPYLEEAMHYGLKTFIDCTPAYLGRDPLLLKELSEITGLQILTNTGYYGAMNYRFLPESFYQMNPEEIAEIWIDEAENGIDGTGIRPGFIKIGINPGDSLSEPDLKIITAAAIAHKKTGLMIASHTGQDAPAFAQLEVLKEKEVDPSAFIWVHAQRGTLEGNIRAARMGAWISLDNVNVEREEASIFSIDWYADRIFALKQEDLLNKVLISHDAGWYSPGEPNGGNFRGFTGVFAQLIPALKARGFTGEDIETLLSTNPENAFALKPAG